MNNGSVRRARIAGIIALALCMLFVSFMDVNAASIRLNKKNVTLTAGKSVVLKVKGTSKKVTWRSSNKKVATVSVKGKVVAKRQGKATIYAKLAGKKLKCNVVVKKKSKPLQPVKPEPLSTYWSSDSAAAKELRSYLTEVTDPNSQYYIPPKDRIAVFDLDGTLMCETYPWCFEYMVFADYALNSGSPNITDEVRGVAQEIIDSAWGEKPKNMSTRQASAAAIAYRGMTMAEVRQMVRNFRTSPADGFTNMTREQAYYKPMVELFQTLQENGFTNYVVTATERNIVRFIIEDTLDIPASNVIGTEYGYTATGQGETPDGDYTFAPTDEVVFDGTYAGENAKTSKVDSIVREIGKQPVLAFGNSSGDVAMQIYTISANPYKSASFMVMADDEEREYGDTAAALAKKPEYENQGISIISMKDDFKTIYGDEVTKTR